MTIELTQLSGDDEKEVYDTKKKGGENAKWLGGASPSCTDIVRRLRDGERATCGHWLLMVLAYDKC